MNTNVGQENELVRIQVFWDERDPQELGWHYFGFGLSGLKHWGGLDPDLSFDDAIDEACFELGVGLTHDDFARCRDDGGWAEWLSDGPAPWDDDFPMRR